MSNYIEQTELKQDTFTTLPAIRGEQFGRDIYSTIILAKDLERFLAVFPEVQRDINPRKVVSIKNYILTGLMEEKPLRFFPSITVSCRGNTFFDDATQRVAMNIKEVKLSVNDGQHRMMGTISAINQLTKDFHECKNDKKEQLKEMLDKLNTLGFSVTIFGRLEEAEEKQLFHDTNTLAQKVSKNVNIKLNQVDPFARLATELSFKNEHLQKMGVELEKASIHRNNDNTILLSTVYESLKIMYAKEIKQNRSFVNEETYNIILEEVNDVYNKIFEYLPEDVHIKGKYFLEKSFAFKGIARYIAENKYNLLGDPENLYKALDINWTYNTSEWEYDGGTLVTSANNNIYFTGGYEGGVRCVRLRLTDRLHKLNKLA